MQAAGVHASESTLPRGWSSCTHAQLNATCYVHTVSRVCTWSRPRVVDTDEPEQVAMPEAEGPLVSRSLLEEQLAMQSYWDRRRSSDNARELEQLDPKERLQRELCRRPRQLDKGAPDAIMAHRNAAKVSLVIDGVALDLPHRGSNPACI